MCAVYVWNGRTRKRAKLTQRKQERAAKQGPGNFTTNGDGLEVKNTHDRTLRGKKPTATGARI